MDFNTYLHQDVKNQALDEIYKGMPRYLSSKHRVHKMFFKKCDGDVGKYETCLGNPKW